MYNKQLKSYTFTIPANGAFPLLVESDYFRIQSATGEVDVEGDTFGKLPDLLTGQGLENTSYRRLVFTDKTGAPNTITVLCSGAMFIDNRTYGVVTVSGAIEVDAPSIAAIKLPAVAGASFVAGSSLVANTAEVIFLPAANVNGAVILSADLADRSASLGRFVLTARSAAPATPADGEHLMTAMIQAETAASFVYSGSLAREMRIAAGLGLYFISSIASGGGGNTSRNCRYILL